MSFPSAFTSRRFVGVAAALALAGLVIFLGLKFFAYRAKPLGIVVFQDVTASSGLMSVAGMTYGAAWGDFDGDGRPDLYVPNHLNAAKLYRNLGGGRFADVTAEWFSQADLGGDKHGAAWADFDNDGRLDLVQLRGAERGVGSETKRLFVNRGRHFEDIGEAVGIANPLSRTRMPLWFDADGDGRLDLFEGAEARPGENDLPLLFLQRNGEFEPAPDAARFRSQSAPFCVLTALSASGMPDIVCRVSRNDRAEQIFSAGRLPMQERDLLPETAFEDIAAGDFDNDGAIDLFLARKYPAPPVALARPAATEIIADLLAEKGGGKPLGFAFRAASDLAFRIDAALPPGALSPKNVFIGARGTHPAGLEFRLAPAESDLGAAPSTSTAAPGLYISLDAPATWHVDLRPGLVQGEQQVAIKVVSSGPIDHLEVQGGRQGSEAAPARLFMNRAGRLFEESEKRGVNAQMVSAVNVVAADFNNDMYLDLFVVASGEVGKQENLLLLNRGDGRFDVVKDAGGAAGGTAGVGDSVTTVDFDGDGFMDLLVTTGGSMGRSFGLPSEAGGYHLYRNVLNNGNRWLEIDLEGTRSNRDGIGARVELTAAGMTQVRVQDGGVHHRGQNHARLHFGLAKQAKADRIVVRWPSGTVQELKDVAGNQRLRIREP